VPVYGAVIDGQPACLGACRSSNSWHQREQMIAAVLDVARVLAVLRRAERAVDLLDDKPGKVDDCISAESAARATHWRGTAISSGCGLSRFTCLASSD